MRTVLLILLVAAAPVAADVALADIFGDLMVLQRGRKVPVWGTAEPGEKVTAAFLEQSVSTKADADGRWRVMLGPFEAVAARPLTVTAKNTIRLDRVFVGEVWVCSGQSNMQWPLERTTGAKKELDELANPRLFFYSVRRKVSEKPSSKAHGKWVRASPATAAKFSAVAYYFGKSLRAELAIPVGLIHTSWGGTPAEAWTRRRELEEHEELKPILERWDRAINEFPEKKKAWQLAVQNWKAVGSKGRRPGPPLGPNHPHRASGLFNGMIAPVVPFGIRGAIWYQGESNAGRAEQYRTLFPAMIRDWRDAWGQGDFPFYFVQLANWRKVAEQPGESAWAELREAQALALKQPATGMAVTIDIGEARDIHPRNKKDVGERLARLARAQLYEVDVVPSGPLLDTHAVKDGKVILKFTHAKGLAARDGEKLRGFAISGEDRKFLWAHARIDGETIVVSHPDVANPVSVRYAWADNPVCNLVNGAALPAGPFRLDEWPGVTAGRR